MSQVRARFAPSPTGYLHVGGARTALINWAFARKHGGAFVLRIEDTDLDRSTEESFGSIITSLIWLGLDWDEGPEKGGEFGPYRQSECFDLYESEAGKLLERGDAYHCYCSPEELEERRKAALKEGRSPGYDNRCRSLSSSQMDAFIAEGRQPVVRFRVPDVNSVVVEDIVRGRVSFDTKEISDFVILRADKIPTFHFANVIDDMRMRISHVIRGEDHLSNTPRHVLLFQALGAEPPNFAHLSLLLGPDGARLSKRHGATAVEDFKEAGYLREAIVNWLALLGFAPADGQEVFSLEQFAEKFDLTALGKSAAVFDKAKLDWLNGNHIREMAPEKLLELCRPYLQEAGYDLSQYSQESQVDIAASIQKNLTVLPDCVAEASIYFEPIEALFDDESREYLKSNPLGVNVVSALAEEMNKLETVTSKDIGAIGKALQKATGAKGKELYMPVRIAVTGKTHGPELAKAIPVLGRDECVMRSKKIQEIL